MASWYSGPTLTREQAAQVLYQAGIRGDDLAFLVAVAERESSYIAGAHRSDRPREAMSGDRGLWQINYIWDDDLRGAGIIRNPQDLFDPLTNARAAAFIMQRQGRGAWGVPGGSFGGASKSLNMTAANAAVQRAASQGLLGQDWQSTATQAATATATATATGGATSQQPVNLPSDARIVRTEDGAVRAIFQAGPGVWIGYGIPSDGSVNWQGRPVEQTTTAAMNQKYRNMVNGGNAAELAEIPTAFGTYAAYTNTILDQLFARGDPRRNDPEVMQVAAQIMGRPDMTDAEIENLLKGTNYYQQRTEGQLRWNDLSQAERMVQQRDTLARMQQAAQQYVGGTPAWTATMPDVVAIASGAKSFSAWVEAQLKPLAASNPDSPWSRQLREDKEAQLQRPLDIENTMLRIRDTLTDWAVPMSDKTIRSWATGIMEKTKSDDDLMNFIKQQAQVLFPWKDPEMETVVAAAPWIETYNRVLERQGSLQTPEIARTLSAYGRDPDNNDVWSFEQKLKMTDAYDQTRQGQDDAWSTVDELAGMMGF